MLHSQVLKLPVYLNFSFLCFEFSQDTAVFFICDCHSNSLQALMHIQALICIKTVRWTFDLRSFFYPLFSLSRGSKVRSMRALMHTNLTVSLKTNAHVLFQAMELQTCSSAGCCLKQSSGRNNTLQISNADGGQLLTFDLSYSQWMQ